MPIKTHLDIRYSHRLWISQSEILDRVLMTFPEKRNYMTGVMKTFFSKNPFSFHQMIYMHFFSKAQNHSNWRARKSRKERGRNKKNDIPFNFYAIYYGEKKMRLSRRDFLWHCFMNPDIHIITSNLQCNKMEGIARQDTTIRAFRIYLISSNFTHKTSVLFCWMKIYPILKFYFFLITVKSSEVVYI